MLRIELMNDSHIDCYEIYVTDCEHMVTDGERYIKIVDVKYITEFREENHHDD